MRKKIVITGLGIFSPLGIGINAYWKNFLRGKFPIRKINLFPTGEFRCKKAFQIGRFNFNKYFRDLKSGYLTRSTKFLLLSVKTALADSNLCNGFYNNEEIGVFTSTIYGSCGNSYDFYRDVLLKGPESVNPMAFPPVLTNYPSSYLSIINGFKGPNLTFSSGFHAGLEAINFAANLIKQKHINAAVVSGLNDLGIENYTGLNLKQALYKPDRKRGYKIKIFDKSRQGAILGEGSSTVILEDMANAKKRKAKIYAEVLGYSANFGKDIDSYARMIKEVIKNSNLTAKQIDLCIVNANGIREIDLMERNAIEKVFAVNLNRIDLIAVKENNGEGEGASAILQALAAAKALQERKKATNTLINSLNMEGNNAALIMRKAG